MTNAASSENREIREEMAYKGTMTIIRITILRSNVSLSGKSPVRKCAPLQRRLEVVLEMQVDGHH
jgi:hypothetical protein